MTTFWKCFGGKVDVKCRICDTITTVIQKIAKNKRGQKNTIYRVFRLEYTTKKLQTEQHELY